MLCFLSIVFGVLAMSCRSQNLPENICSDYFGYVQDGGIWYGEITVPSLKLGTHYIDVRFTQRGQPPSSVVGPVLPYPDLNTTLQSIGRNRPVIFRLRLNPHQAVLAKLSRFALNGQVLCQGEEYPDWNENRYYNITQTSTQTNFIRKTGYEIIRDTAVPNYDVCCQTFRQFEAFGNGDRRPQNSPDLNHPPQRPQLPWIQSTIQRPLIRDQASPLQYPLPWVTPTPTQTSSTTTTQKSSSTSMATITIAMPSPKPIQIESQNFECGNKTRVEFDRFPWLTAIYYRMGAASDYKCSGSLISRKVVITAAHCVIEKSPEDIFAWVGRYNLHSPSEGGVHEIHSIERHPDFIGKAVPDADVAILTFILPVTYTRKVRPICIWDAKEPIALGRKEKGYVAGWRGDEIGTDITRYPQVVNAELVSESECRKEVHFQKFITNRTLCAGNLDGSGPCVGNSGAGLMIERDGRWLLRGILSLGVRISLKCDNSQYVIYCDLAKHIDWVQRKLN